MSKEQKGISRREFLIGAGAVAVGAALRGCKQGEKEKATPLPTEKPIVRPTLEPTAGIKPTATQIPAVEPTPKPTHTPEPSPTSEPTHTPEPSPTSEPSPTKEEIINIPGVTITEELLKKAFEGIGGGEMIEPSFFGTPTPESSEEKEEPMSLVEFGKQYVPDAWGKKISLEQLTKDPMASLKYMVTLGTYAGVEGAYSPGGASGNEVFPYLFKKGVQFLRVQIPEVPSEREQQLTEFQEGVMPHGFILRPDTYMTVVGRFKGKLISRPASEEGEYALVAFDDWFRKYAREEESIAPFLSWGIIPVSLPNSDSENKEAFTLKNLLAKGGVDYNQEAGEAHFTNKEGKKVVEGINEFKGEELVQKIKEDAGVWFVDQIKDELIANPIVPYPSEELELPAYWNVQRKEEENGEVFISIEGGESMEEEFKELAQARYDEEAGEWRWKKIEAEPILELTKAPEIKGLVFKEGKYYAKEDNPYGLEEGEYAGEFVPNVTMETEEGKEETTGGLVLTAPVVLAELNQQLAKIPEQDDRWLIPLPVDIRGLEGISITYGKDELEVPVVKVVYPGSAPLVNIIPEADKLRIGKTFLGDWCYIDHMRLIEPYTDSIYPGLEMRYLTVRGDFLGFRENITLPTTFGAKIGEARKPIYVAVESVRDIRSVTPDKILYVDQTPVFVAANTP